MKFGSTPVGLEHYTLMPHAQYGHTCQVKWAEPDPAPASAGTSSQFSICLSNSIFPFMPQDLLKDRNATVHSEKDTKTGRVGFTWTKGVFNYMTHLSQTRL